MKETRKERTEQEMQKGADQQRIRPVIHIEVYSHRQESTSSVHYQQQGIVHKRDTARLGCTMSKTEPPPPPPRCNMLGGRGATLEGTRVHTHTYVLWVLYGLYAVVDVVFNLKFSWNILEGSELQRGGLMISTPHSLIHLQNTCRQPPRGSFLAAILKIK